MVVTASWRAAEHIVSFQFDRLFEFTPQLSCPAGPASTSRAFDSNALPELPSVPDTLPTSSISGHPTSSDDIDFDDLTRRFEELKKKT